MKGHADGSHYAYGGIAAIIGGPSVSNTVSDTNPEPGICIAFQASLVATVQVGVDMGSGLNK